MINISEKLLTWR